MQKESKEHLHTYKIGPGIVIKFIFRLRTNIIISYYIDGLVHCENVIRGLWAFCGISGQLAQKFGNDLTCFPKL